MNDDDRRRLTQELNEIRSEIARWQTGLGQLDRELSALLKARAAVLGAAAVNSPEFRQFRADSSRLNRKFQWRQNRLLKLNSRRDALLRELGSLLKGSEAEPA